VTNAREFLTREEEDEHVPRSRYTDDDFHIDYA
jgi:hypothetical protein